MANSKKPKGNVGSKVGPIATAIAVVGPVAIDFLDRILKPNESNSIEDHVLVPELCSKRFPLKLPEAKELLENSGLKALPIEVPIKDANPKYRDCFEFQVVSSNYKANSKVKSGKTIIIQYVTQEIINESQRLYDEAEKQRAIVKQERAVKRAEQMERAKGAVADAAGKAKSGVEKIIHRDNARKDIKTDPTNE